MLSNKLSDMLSVTVLHNQLGKIAPFAFRPIT